MSSIEESVIEKIRSRAETGLLKYGTTMEREDLSVKDWLIHLQEELMDGIIYAQRLLKEMDENGETDRLNK